MAVSSVVNRLSFAGNGVTVAFAFPEFLNAATDLVALLVDNTTGVATTWVLNTDYTLALTTLVNGVYPGGATLTALVAPATGKTLVLYRDVPITQSTHWTDNDAMPSGTTETTHDRAFTVMQRLKDLCSRAMVLPDGYAGAFSPALPAVLTANSVFSVSADGLSVIVQPPTGVALAYKVMGTYVAPILISANGVIAFTAGYQKTKVCIAGSGAAQVASNIQVGTVDGQELLLLGCSNANTVTLDTGGVVILNGTYTMGASSQLLLNWDAASGAWREVSRSD